MASVPGVPTEDDASEFPFPPLRSVRRQSSPNPTVLHSSNAHVPNDPFFPPTAPLAIAPVILQDEEGGPAILPETGAGAGEQSKVKVVLGLLKKWVSEGQRHRRQMG
jgi:hypothetical protein